GLEQVRSCQPCAQARQPGWREESAGLQRRRRAKPGDPSPPLAKRREGRRPAGVLYSCVPCRAVSLSLLSVPTHPRDRQVGEDWRPVPKTANRTRAAPMIPGEERHRLDGSANLYDCGKATPVWCKREFSEKTRHPYHSR